MDISLIDENHYEPMRISTASGCDSSGKPVDNLGRVINYDPCPFGQRYNCNDAECKYSPWFLFVILGLPFLGLIILVVGISIIIRFTKEKKY